MQILIQNLGPLWKVVCLWNMGVDVPQSAVTAVLKEHAKWQKQLEKRHTSEYLKKSKSKSLQTVFTRLTI